MSGVTGVTYLHLGKWFLGHWWRKAPSERGLDKNCSVEHVQVLVVEIDEVAKAVWYDTF